MPLFDAYTTKILLEATGVTGGVGKIGKKSKSKPTLGGGAGRGAPKIKETKVTPSGSEQTIMFGDTKMPSGPLSGPGIYSQAGWANYARTLNTALEGTTAGGAIGGLTSLITSLPIPGASKGAISNYATKMISLLGAGGPIGAAGLDYATKQAIRTGAAEAYLSGFGKLGSAIGGKIPGLAAIGVDPLEWSLKAFGADAALQGLASTPAKTQAALGSPLGYLQKGKSRGIY